MKLYYDPRDNLSAEARRSITYSVFCFDTLKIFCYLAGITAIFGAPISLIIKFVGLFTIGLVLGCLLISIIKNYFNYGEK